MSQTVRLAVVAVILAGGFGLAMQFRQSGDSHPPSPQAPSPLQLRAGAETPDGPRQVDGPVRRLAPDDPALPPDVELSGAPAERLGAGAEQPPEFPSHYNADLRIPTDEAPASPDVVRQPARTPMTATHKIVDGDTLSSLAVRYLGDERRYMEIYQQNRDVLSSPHTLPIGRTLRMPPRDASTASRGDSPRNPGDLAPELHPLVPRS